MMLPNESGSDPASLLKLAKRCEREEPSQDLDECIWSNIAGDDFAYETTPHYTTSLDAAVTLVPEDMTWSIDWEAKDRPDRRATAETYPEGSEIISQASTPALALCAAALRTRAQAKHRSGG